jgi:L-ascorbate metabolism protein UlaG (beta-lactamase superfamily)
VIRSTAGTLDSPVGEVVAISSEHDPVAGTQRGPNSIFVFELDGLRVAHFGDFGQAALRDEQAAAIGSVDLLFLPVGGGPTLGAAGALAVVERLAPSWVIPMHYRTPRIGFLETADEFLAAMPSAHTAGSTAVDTAALTREDRPQAVVLQAP